MPAWEIANRGAKNIGTLRNYAHRTIKFLFKLFKLKYANILTILSIVYIGPWVSKTRKVLSSFYRSRVFTIKNTHDIFLNANAKKEKRHNEK